MFVRQILSVVLVAITFIAMVTVVGFHLPLDHRYYGGWIWGLAWFPFLLVVTMTIVLESNDESSPWVWISGMVMSYSTLLVGTLWYHQSLSQLLTETGLLECCALAIGYLVTIIWVAIEHSKPFGDWLFPQLFGVSLLALVVGVVTQTMWQLQLLSLSDLLFLGIAVLFRAIPIVTALRTSLT